MGRGQSCRLFSYFAYKFRLSLSLTSCLILQRFASVYRNVVFLHFYAESNQMTKYLDQVRLKVEQHPHFAFFRSGKHVMYLCVSKHAKSFLFSSFALHATPVSRGTHGILWTPEM